MVRGVDFAAERRWGRMEGLSRRRFIVSLGLKRLARLIRRGSLEGGVGMP